MILELGNHAPAHQDVVDDQPKITTIHIPEFDDGSHHPDAVWEHEQHGQFKRGDAKDGIVPEGSKLVQAGQRLGGYTHEVGGISVDEFKNHLMESILSRKGITQLPGHEALLAILHPDGVATQHLASNPAWVKAHPHELTPNGVAQDIEKFLAQYWGCPNGDEFFDTADPEEQLVRKELQYWTRTAPGEFPAGAGLPDLKAFYTNSGRVINNLNDGGGKVGLAGTGTAATATSLTTGVAMLANEWAGYRVYCMQTTAGPILWSNVLSNTSGGVFTLDRWYSAATPGGSAPSAPSSGYYFLLADGGAVSTWFLALSTTNITQAAGDNFLTGEYNVAGGGMNRKIAPYAQTSGIASRSITLTPVYTVNGSDTPLPSTFYALGVFGGMVVTASSPFGPFKFEPSLNASATVTAVNDQVTVTETVTGS